MASSGFISSMHDLRLFEMVFYKIMDSNAREVGIIWQQGEPGMHNTWKLLTNPSILYCGLYWDEYSQSRIGGACSIQRAIQLLQKIADIKR